jgi:hypothetical protein
MSFLIFFKFCAYSAFIYSGYQTFRGDKTEFIFRALGVGLARLIGGFILGWFFLYLGFSTFGDPSTRSVSGLEVFAYLLPSTFLLWLIVARNLAGRIDRKTLAWASAGVALSVVFDAYAVFISDWPVIIADWPGPGYC